MAKTNWDVDTFLNLFYEVCDGYQKIMKGKSEYLKSEARKKFQEILDVMRIEGGAFVEKCPLDFATLEMILEHYPGEFKDQMKELKAKMNEMNGAFEDTSKRQRSRKGRKSKGERA